MTDYGVRATQARVLVAGVGNIFLGDDGFGVEVANRLLERPQPDGVKVADFGIRGLHLAYELLEGYELVVLVDALHTGDEPGAIVVFEPDAVTEGGVPPDAHDMNPETVLGLLADLGGHVERLLIVGCEPADLGERIGLSDRMWAAVDDAVGVVEELIEEELRVYAGKES
ncbi:MAG: hydrogenase maturation protease [Acidimicrobiales bacterium]